jgi:3-keto-L-gulonate-6-phosphate decarboxylase
MLFSKQEVLDVINMARNTNASPEFILVALDLKPTYKERIEMFGKIKQHDDDILDDGTPFVTKEKSRVIFEKFKTRRF